MQLDEIQRRSREIFRLEAADLLRDLESALLELEADPANEPLIHRAFRVMHTLKGSGATSGFQELSDFLHHVEDVFNAAREGQLRLNGAMIDLTLKLGDAVTRYLAAEPAEAPAVLTAAGKELAALLAYLPSRDASARGGSKTPAPSAGTFLVRFGPRPEVFLNGTDPGMFLDDLRQLGACTVRGFLDRLPSLATLDPETCHARWEIEVETGAGETGIREVFAFIDGECDLEISPLPSPSAKTDMPGGTASWQIEFTATERTLAAPGVLEALWRDLERFGRLTVLSSPANDPARPSPGLWRIQLQTAANAETIGSAFVFLLDAQPKLVRQESGAPAAPSLAPVPAPVAPAGAAAAARSAPAKNGVAAHGGGDTLRVSAERLDRLVNLVGELVILRSQVSTALARQPHPPPELQSAAEALQSLSTEMRDVILNIRMMPIEQTFAKFRRLVRDLARDLGKEVELVVEGGETEMDKTVLDALSDPLMHLVRNSLDHGLETSADRVAAGKSAHGILRLRAEQRGDRVLVSVMDDGRGLDAQKIRAKAVKKGLISSEAVLSDAELFQLVFLPGFSTAETVSQVSGRGVGLDVVRRHIEQLRGKVEVRSTRGQGAEFRLSLPLTLAIIEGLMVEVDGDRYILPLGTAREAIELPHVRRRAGNGRNLVGLRGEMVPYVRLRDVFGSVSEPPDPERVVIAELEDQRIGIAVDRVIGSHQTVLKSLGWLGRRVNVFSGATVLGDGHIALILDLPALIAHHRASQGAADGLRI